MPLEQTESAAEAEHRAESRRENMIIIIVVTGERTTNCFLVTYGKIRTLRKCSMIDCDRLPYIYT